MLCLRRFPRLLGAFLFGLASLQVQAGEKAQAQACREAVKSFFERNPKKVTVGVAHVHAHQLEPGDSAYTVSVVVPALHPQLPSRLADLRTQDPRRPWAERFVITDGAVGAQMVLVDQRPGSALSMQLDALLREMKGRGVDLKSSKSVLKDLRDHTEDFYRGSSGNLLAGHRDAALKISKQKLGADGQKVFGDFRGKDISGDVWASSETRDAVPLEAFLADSRDTMCFHNALLASLLLQRVGVPHRLRAGFASFGRPSYDTTGHTIIELADGRILDPTWHLLKKKKPHADYPGWIEGDGWYWTDYDHYPYLILE
jgi:hypothetical protein